ncbi:MAG: sulfurtransferase-like selenium metabolism protein YedF [Atopobiaceae bacterium]|jgi:selenium metabolism protein YedF
MSDKVEVNAIGDACPVPVVKTIKAIKELSGAGSVITKVDNETAVKNLTKLASDKGYGSETKNLEDGTFEVTTTVTGNEAPATEADADFADPSKSKVVVVISSDQMGVGDEELGHSLLKNFIYSLTQEDVLPSTMLFYNTGVRMVCEGSPALDDLKALQDAGVEILACGICLNYYNLSDKLAVGEVSNMYAIAGKQLEASVVVKP